MARDILASEQCAFAASYQPERYKRLKDILAEKAGVPVLFRIAEMPCFFHEELLAEAGRFGLELIAQVTENREYLERARREIPVEHLCANEADQPLFVQADFGLIRNESGALQWKLVEIQGFPSLYAFQPALAEAYVEAYGIDEKYRWFCAGLDYKSYLARLRDAIVGSHDPENVVLLEVHPEQQKTLPDFKMTEKLFGISTVCLSQLLREKDRLYYKRGDRQIPIYRIYNRVIVDELDRSGVDVPFRFSQELDVEWAGHPNWYFLLSKFSIPFFRHPCVPRSWFLSELAELPGNPENLVLKPLYSFAGQGVKVGVSPNEIGAIPTVERRHYLLQERLKFEPLIETPFGANQVEVRVMYISSEPVTYILRTGRGKMMGVDHNRDLEWVGASAALFY